MSRKREDGASDAAGIAGIAHHPDAARRSWAAMLDLFEEALGLPRPAALSGHH